MKPLKIKNNSGFTLIELLTVISVIAFISSIGLASFQNANLKARDAKRKHDLSQLKTAMDLYYDANGAYPPLADGTETWSYENAGDWTAAFKTAMSPYLNPPPKDPTNIGSYYYSYYYVTAEPEPACERLLYTSLENPNDSDWLQCTKLCCQSYPNPSVCNGAYCIPLQ